MAKRHRASLAELVVYQARDTRLDRIVAIKVLPEALAGDFESARTIRARSALFDHRRPGSGLTNALGINETGQIVGSYIAGGVMRGFLFCSKRVRDRDADGERK